MRTYRCTASFFAAVFCVFVASCSGTNRTEPPVQSGAFDVPLSFTPGTTVPFFQSSFTFNGTVYTYRMVGTNPQTSRTVTTIPTEIVPVKLIFSDGTTFDPSAVVSTLRTSPIFSNAAFAAGTTQYGDAQMRSEFWKFAGGSNYHVLLGKPTVFPTVTEHVLTNGRIILSGGSKMGRITFDWFINTVEPQLIKQLGIKPTSLTFFSTLNTRVLEPGSATTTFGGYHDSFHLTTSAGTGTFGTIWGAMFSANTRDVTHVGHEVVEWLNDPFYPTGNDNKVPAWIHPTSHVCNGNLLEVGDPVTTDRFTIDGYTFEDAAFFSWFSRQGSSIGISGRYDLLGLLKHPAMSC